MTIEIPITDASVAIAGIQALLDDREACEARISEINSALQKARGLIDARTIGVQRKPRIAATDAPEPPAVA